MGLPAPTRKPECMTSAYVRLSAVAAPALLLLCGLLRLPVWSPVLMFAGFLAVGADLDLLPLRALLVGAGLAPLAVTRRTPARG
jgi:hypothetical protein